MNYGCNFFYVPLFSEDIWMVMSIQDWSGVLFLLLAWSSQAAGPEPKHRTRQSALLLGKWLKWVEGTTICLSDNNVQFDLFQWVFSLCYPSIQPVLPCFSSSTMKSKCCFPLMQRRERYRPRMPKLVTERSISRLLSLFRSKIRFYFPLFPHATLPLPSLLSFLFLTSHRLAESQARVVGGVWCFISVPTILCYIGGWVRTIKSGAKKRGGEHVERLVGGGQFFKKQVWVLCLLIWFFYTIVQIDLTLEKLE